MKSKKLIIGLIILQLSIIGCDFPEKVTFEELDQKTNEKNTFESILVKSLHHFINDKDLVEQKSQSKDGQNSFMEVYIFGEIKDTNFINIHRSFFKKVFHSSLPSNHYEIEGFHFFLFDENKPTTSETIKFLEQKNLIHYGNLIDLINYHSDDSYFFLPVSTLLKFYKNRGVWEYQEISNFPQSLFPKYDDDDFF